MPKFQLHSCIAAALFLLAAVPPATAQTTWYVDVNAAPPGLGTQAQPYASIQYAIAQGSTISGDTLLVAPGEYVENVSTLQKALTLRSSAGPLLTTIRPQQTGWAVQLLGAAELEGFTITGALGPGGAVFVSNGVSNLRRCIIRDNVGSGIVGNTLAYVFNCTVTGNDFGLRTLAPGGNAQGNACVVNFNGVDLQPDMGSFGIHLKRSVIGVEDPGFWNYDERDLRLRPGSIAIDFGGMSLPDPDGSPSDAGALIYDPTYAPGPSAYCTGKLNSQGCVPAIGAIGSASASSAAPFVVTADQELPGVPGLLFFGLAPSAAPFQGAWHCVEPPSPRVGGQVSMGSGPCGGTFSFDMNAYIQSGVHPSLVPGELVYCQWWSRDLQDPAGFGTGLTDALYFGIAP